MLSKYDFTFFAGKLLVNETKDLIKCTFEGNDVRFVPKNLTINGIEIFGNVEKSVHFPYSLYTVDNALANILNKNNTRSLDEIVLDIVSILKLHVLVLEYYHRLNIRNIETTCKTDFKEALGETKITKEYYSLLSLCYAKIMDNLHKIENFKIDNWHELRHLSKIGKIIFLVDNHLDHEGFEIDKYVIDLQNLLLNICGVEN
jgi:hypothetical protein